MLCFEALVLWRLNRFWAWLGVIAIGPGFAEEQLYGQTVSTGAATGVTLDPSGAALPGVILRLTKDEGGETKWTTSDDRGRFSFLLVPPGAYQLEAQKTDFEPLTIPDIHVTVTETLRVELRLQLATRHERAETVSSSLMVDIDSSALGRDIGERAMSSLPLVTRNFTQIAGLSPGVAGGVMNAGELGLGGTALSQIAKSNDGIYVHGARPYDNNFELDRISVSDVQGSASGSGGIPFPNPDTIEEFKVQTGLFDAAFGCYAGANISCHYKNRQRQVSRFCFRVPAKQCAERQRFFPERNSAAAAGSEAKQ